MVLVVRTFIVPLIHGKFLKVILLNGGRNYCFVKVVFSLNTFRKICGRKSEISPECDGKYMCKICVRYIESENIFLSNASGFLKEHFFMEHSQASSLCSAGKRTM